MRNSQKLVQTLRKTNATPVECAMAASLLAVNGIENALEFVYRKENAQALASGKPPLALE